MFFILGARYDQAVSNETGKKKIGCMYLFVSIILNVRSFVYLFVSLFGQIWHEIKQVYTASPDWAQLEILVGVVEKDTQKAL